MNPPPIETEIVQDAVSSASVLNHIRQNRIEYLLAIGLLHLLGVTDRVLGQLTGLCI